MEALKQTLFFISEHSLNSQGWGIEVIDEGTQAHSMLTLVFFMVF